MKYLWSKCFYYIYGVNQLAGVSTEGKNVLSLHTGTKKQKNIDQ